MGYLNLIALKVFIKDSCEGLACYMGVVCLVAK